MRSFFKHSIWVFILVLININSSYSAVTASVDKNPAMADESIVLKVVADSDVQRNAFDPSPLLKDFIVGRTSVSSQTQMLNFKTTRTTIWNTTLVPRKEGTFTVPALSVGNERTQPFQIKILPVSAASNGAGRDLFITAELDSSQVYLQQQIKYTVKLHLSQNLQRGSLAAPKLENAEVRQIGEDANYSSIIGGKRYQIIERVFAIIPQQSGKFTIEGPLFQGDVVDDSRQSFGFFNRTKSVSRVGPSVELEVLAIPSGFNDSWIPSEFVDINEQWQSENDEYLVGNPITRTITLTAVGLVEEQLPEIDSRYPPQVKTYPDQASTATVEKDGTLIAQRVENVAIIPNQAGIFVIPEVIVPWFNTRTKKTQYAKLEARSIEVKANPIQSQTSAPIMANLDPIATPSALSDADAQATPPTIEVVESDFWFYISAALMALWLITLVLWFWLARLKNSTNNKPPSTNISHKHHWQALDSALKSGQPQQVCQTLPAWLSQLLGFHGATLAQCQAKLQDPQFDKLISQMFACQYSQQQNSWDSTKLRAYLATIEKQQHYKMENEKALKPLYPQTQ